MRKSLLDVLSYHATIIYNTSSYRNLLVADLINTYAVNYNDVDILTKELTEIKNILNIRLDVKSILDILKTKNYFNPLIRANPVK